MLLIILAAVSASAFAYYGRETLFAVTPRSEYERYGLPKLRAFVGAMQLLGAAGVALGLFFAPLGAAAASGLVAMMLMALGARYRIRDAPRLMIPAASLAVLNAILVFLFTAR